MLYCYSLRMFSIEGATLPYSLEVHCSMVSTVSECSLHGQTVFLLGDTGESDPHLLRHSSLASHDPNLVIKISYRQVHRDRSLLDAKIIDNYRPLVFMIENHSLHDKYEPRVDDEALRKARPELEDICSEEVGVRLVKLYFRYVYPYLPICHVPRLYYPNRAFPQESKPSVCHWSAIHGL
jgi:hypothetical protein